MTQALLGRLACPVEDVDTDLSQRVQSLLDNKTKPVGSLGRIEQLACRYACIRGELQPAPPRAAVVVAAADHGVAEEGVSAYPQEVTRQMLLNFAAGGAAINAIARSVGATLSVVDVGTKGPTPNGVLERKVTEGTRNMARGPAMTDDEAEKALRVGIELAEKLDSQGVSIVGLGEMGIANTTAAAALTAVLTGSELERVVGPGTGVQGEALQKKKRVIAEAIRLNRVTAESPFQALVRVGGLEIAALAGLTLGAASRRMAVMMDGFIASSAALVAAKLCPAVRGYLIASHCSQEPGHRAILDELELRELLDFELRLGEGTGAALAMPIVRSAVAVLTEMATFESAGVSERNS